jgi:hypothetical protein
MIKSRRMKWFGYVACREEKRDAFRVLVQDLKERYHMEDLGIVGRIILKWI